MRFVTPQRKLKSIFETPSQPTAIENMSVSLLQSLSSWFCLSLSFPINGARKWWLEPYPNSISDELTAIGGNRLHFFSDSGFQEVTSQFHNFDDSSHSNLARTGVLYVVSKRSAPNPY